MIYFVPGDGDSGATDHSDDNDGGSGNNQIRNPLLNRISFVGYTGFNAVQC